MKLKLYNKYHIKWRDAHSGSGWTDKSEIDVKYKDEDLMVETLGFFIKETELSYIFTMSFSNECVDAPFSILKSSIVKISLI